MKTDAKKSGSKETKENDMLNKEELDTKVQQ